MTRVSVLVEARDEQEVADVEAWLDRHWSRLTVVENTGCGCCIVAFDIEAPTDIAQTLPGRWLSASDWADEDFVEAHFSEPPPVRPRSLVASVRAYLRDR